jgi:hypothetical protein
MVLALQAGDYLPAVSFLPEGENFLAAIWEAFPFARNP